MEKKITGDILTFKKAFDICSDLMDKALKAEDHAGAATLAKAMRLFHEAMENSDEEMNGLREETEGFKSSESAAAFDRSLMRDARSWGKDEEDRTTEPESASGMSWSNYIDDHCEDLTSDDQREENVPDSEFGEEK